MIITTFSTIKQYLKQLRILTLILICLILIATPAISNSNTGLNKTAYNSDSVDCSSLNGCTVEITRPARDLAYFFDGFEIITWGIHLPIIIGGITCKAKVNISNGVEPAFLQWRFANWLGDEYWSQEYIYKPGQKRYEHYTGGLNFGQFKIWIYCFDKYNQEISVSTISCLKLL
jgi:hypothetical protein